MHHAYPLTAIVTVLALLLYFYMGLRVAGARGRYNIPAPAISGNDDFERIFRVQANTLEWLPIFLPSLWMFAFFWRLDWLAAAGGLVWVIGRLAYMIGYSRAAPARSMGFLIQFIGAVFLLLGSLAGAVWLMMHTPR